MTIGLVGRCGMTRVFTEAGETEPVSVIEALPNRVVQVKDAGRDGYRSVQVTVGARRASRLSRPVAGHFAKNRVEPGSATLEFRLAEGEGGELRTGAELKVDLFKPGQVVDVTGTTKRRQSRQNKIFILPLAEDYLFIYSTSLMFGEVEFLFSNVFPCLLSIKFRLIKAVVCDRFLVIKGG